MTLILETQYMSGMFRIYDIATKNLDLYMKYYLQP